jgi:hypothetical protein
MDLTVTVPDELASRLRAVEDQLPEILELGLREWLSTPPGYPMFGVGEPSARSLHARIRLIFRGFSRSSARFSGIA